MSKSLGNFFTLRDLIEKGCDPMAVRYVLMSTHYRQPLNFTLESVEAAKVSIRRLKDFRTPPEENPARKRIRRSWPLRWKRAGAGSTPRSRTTSTPPPRSPRSSTWCAT